MKVEEGFQPTKYPMEHPYLDDPVLPSLLKRILPVCERREVEIDLERIGKELIQNIRPLASITHEATLTKFDEWGRRVDVLQTSEGWRKLKEIATREGFTSIGYERKFGQYSRIHMFAKVMVMTGDMNVVACPFSMTDGAARVIELYGTRAMKKELLPKLISREPNEVYLSGQWMTERTGGSDVSRTETTAKPINRLPTDLGDPYILNGFKWFSSAAEGHMALALARTGDPEKGSKSLSLFIIPVRIPPYNTPLSNNIFIHRLKNKFGTVAVPTAELSLEGTRGWLIGPLNAGVKVISTMLNITRIHSAIHSIGSLQRALSIARAYSTVRSVDRGTRLLKDIPLHVAGLANITLVYRALTHLVFGAIHVLGRVECNLATPEEESRLRLLTPVVKAFAAQNVIGAMEEAMAALGGQGYMEETGIGRLVRDALVEKIWEGTVEVLALDLSRATANLTIVNHYVEWANRILSSDSVEALSDVKKSLKAIVGKLPALLHSSRSNSLMPRIILNVLGNLSAGIYLYEHAVWAVENGETTENIDIEACLRWVREGDLGKCLEKAEYEQKMDGRIGFNSALVYGFQGITRL